MTLEKLAYTAKEVAPLLRLSENRVTEMARKGEIPAVRIGGLWRFPVRRLDEWLEGEVLAANSTANRGRVA